MEKKLQNDFMLFNDQIMTVVSFILFCYGVEFYSFLAVVIVVGDLRDEFLCGIFFSSLRLIYMEIFSRFFEEKIWNNDLFVV